MGTTVTHNMICDECGNEYQRISQHWAWNEDHRPEINELNKERFIGLLMGDGCIESGAGNGNRKNAAMLVHNINKEFLEEIGDLISLPYNISKGKTAEQSFENFGFDHNVNKDNFHAVYRLSFVSHPYFNELKEWYSSGRKRFPKDLSLTPQSLGCWYVCDGSIERRDGRQPRMRIASVNEQGEQTVLDLFKELDVSPKWNGHSIYFSVEDSKKLWNWMERYKSFERKYSSTVIQ